MESEFIEEIGEWRVYQELTIETVCGKCNVTYSGKKAFLRCPHCGEIVQSLRVFMEV